jgi:putative flippase GtrA
MMNALGRWGKFNLVGILGMGVQLAGLALFNRCMANHYLFAVVAAIEVALLHNFIWHVNFTWKDRRNKDTRLHQLLRFHLCNGMVSMAGNLVLMRLLIHPLHVPLLAANALAIACCSVVNYLLGNNWAFALRHN